jgi:ferrochelatase
VRAWKDLDFERNLVKKRTAIILFNLGGPSSLEAVQPFLFNLFYDPAIIALPNPLRWLVAKLISSRRTPTAQHIYAQMGGKSPLLEQTNAQAEALKQAYQALMPEDEVKIGVAMRYTAPRAAQVVAELKAFQPDRILLIPLYPQFSTTTTGSSLKEWHKIARKQGVTAPTHVLGCYPTQEGWITAQAHLIQEKYQSMANPVILFSAHGLPEKIIQAGDPYQWQVEQSCAAVVKKLAINDLEWRICYQSRVGPLKWIGPSTDAVIQEMAAKKRPILVVPIAFVSEHSETLVELDKEYRVLAEQAGVPEYGRVPAVCTHPLFIQGLAEACKNLLSKPEKSIAPAEGEAMCPKEFSACLCR